MQSVQKSGTIGEILREYRNRWSGDVVDITDLCEYAKSLKKPHPSKIQGVAHA
ncbi:MAG: hypothetical protein IKD78_12740 [Bacteroidales bacterium]|nr:hypothetical protein [Bacteroidales bacterium]